MRRLTALLGVHVQRQVLNWSGSWWFLFALTASQLVPPLVGLAVWRAVFPDSSQVSTYYVAMIFVVATTASYENHTFAQLIYKGTLAGRLVEPQSVILAPLGENLAIRAWISAFTLPVVVLLVVTLDVGASPGQLLVAVPFWLAAGVLRFGFTWCLAMTAFWSGRVHAITAFWTTMLFLLGGNAVPVGLLPAGLSEVATNLPFYSMLGVVADTASGGLTVGISRAYAVQLGWLLVVGGVGYGMWWLGRRRYTSVGG